MKLKLPWQKKRLYEYTKDVSLAQALKETVQATEKAMKTASREEMAQFTNISSILSEEMLEQTCEYIITQSKTGRAAIRVLLFHWFESSLVEYVKRPLADRVVAASLMSDIVKASHKQEFEDFSAAHPEFTGTGSTKYPA